jgi:hypothetical protein
MRPNGFKRRCAGTAGPAHLRRRRRETGVGADIFRKVADLYIKRRRDESPEVERSAALALEQAVLGNLFQVCSKFWNIKKGRAGEPEKPIHTAYISRLTI